ncbi:MAG TPA: organic hydroperoxide resistance protein [Acidobacteriaceae bacterium]|nr:organic hydroperoxide resistance protein [Acidobacteriaceae bacterium]
MNVLYTAEVTAVGARHGRATSSDGLLDVALALPPQMGGKGDATNPEQLFGAGYAACFGGAVEYLAQQQKLNTGTITVKSKVGIGPFDEGQGEGFTLRVDLDVTVPELDQAAAEKLVAAAHRVCPYSNATRGNIEVSLTARGGR